MVVWLVVLVGIVQSGCAILFVDGACVLCRWVSRIVVDADSANRLEVAPLRGVTAKSWLNEGDRTKGDWVVLVEEDGRILRGADAMVRTLMILGGIFGIAGRLIGRLPAHLRDAAYQFIAVRRRLWFGTVSTCPLPTSSRRPGAILE